MKSSTGKRRVRISVRTLVEFMKRSGDLKGGTGGWRDKEAMHKGSRIHRKIQKQMGKNYRAEVPLKYEKEYEHYIFVLEGRADGILTENSEVLIDEIKGIQGEIERLEQPLPVHLAQAKCYAYIYVLEQKLPRIQVQITYCQMETEEIRKFTESYTAEDLDLWFSDLLDGYSRWMEVQVLWREKRNVSMQDLAFPFSYRQGQKQLVGDIYRTILRKKQLFVQAPTGIGKTISAVYPAVRALGEGHAERIFYLTAKTITRTVAEEAFETLRKKGLQLKHLTVTAREKLCVCEEVDCDPMICPRAKGHYDRVNDALYHMITEQDCFTREKILEYSERWRICPYELQMDLSSFADGVICDYNYVFDPDVQLRSAAVEGYQSGEIIFLIDEAHNLVDRGREMYSAALIKEDVLEVRKAVRGRYKNLEKALDRVNRILLQYKRQSEKTVVLENVGSLVLAVMNLAGQMEEVLSSIEDGAVRKSLLSFYFQVHSFISISEMADENYVIYSTHLGDGSFMVRFFCVNPAENLQNCLNKGRSAVFFSATMLPVRYYQHLLSGREDDYAVYIASPFAQKNRLLEIGWDVSTRYTRRTRQEYMKIAAYIRKMTEAHRGNYLVYFTSYQMLGEVEKEYRNLCEQKMPELCHLISQKQNMTEAEREEFLAYFTEPSDVPHVGFCVMGGVFGEGIDLTGEALIGVIVVGPGLPQICQERELLRKYYDEKGENGFDIAYRFPGMNKVLQAAGRVIRTPEDRGVILLLDDRFRHADTRSLFPTEWNDCDFCTLQTVEEKLEQFWVGVGEERALSAEQNF